jgi:hypothetical protein
VVKQTLEWGEWRFTNALSSKAICTYLNPETRKLENMTVILNGMHFGIELLDIETKNNSQAV